jgi:hypothetical protein
MQLQQGQGLKMMLIVCIIMFQHTGTLTSPVPVKINGQLLTTEELNPKEHQIIFRRMGDYATDVTFHHVHIPVSLDMINNVVDTAMVKIRSYAENVYQESLMHYHEDNQYADTRKAECYAKHITDQNLFVFQESERSMQYFQNDLRSLTKALPTSASKISKRQINL